MASRRVARLSQAVREVVSSAILFQLRDPRVKNVTVLRVEVASDVRTAKIYVSVLGSEKERALCLHGLNASRGFLQSKIADRIETRYTPVLKFVLEDAVSSAAEEAVRILQELEDERREREAESGPVEVVDDQAAEENEIEENEIEAPESDQLTHEIEDRDE